MENSVLTDYRNVRRDKEDLHLKEQLDNCKKRWELRTRLFRLKAFGKEVVEEVYTEDKAEEWLPLEASSVYEGFHYERKFAVNPKEGWSSIQVQSDAYSSTTTHMNTNFRKIIYTIKGKLFINIFEQTGRKVIELTEDSTRYVIAPNIPYFIYTEDSEAHFIVLSEKI